MMARKRRPSPQGTRSKSMRWDVVIKSRPFRAGRDDVYAGKPFRRDYDAMSTGKQSLYEMGRMFAVCGDDRAKLAEAWNTSRDRP